MHSAVVLFTRDLRVHDNPALTRAAREAERVLPLFVLDDELVAASERRARLLVAALHDLDRSLRGLGAGLVVRRGDVVGETLRAAAEGGAQVVFLAEDVSGYALRRERRLREVVEVRTSPGVTAVPPGMVTPPERDCYRVFTPYHRRWAAVPWRALEEPPVRLALPEGIEPGGLPTAGGDGGETAARARLERWLAGSDSSYTRVRDDLGADATSKLSVPLHLGLVSPLEVAMRSGSSEFVRQLAWRDFYAQILAATPWSAVRDLNPRRREWDDDPDGLATWKEGLTGYPIIDAGMRELAATGFMHNRARMIVASFLTKDLNIDWREGAAHFARRLLDGDVASNTGNWQWVAGTGVDSRPGRIFNPTLQGRRYDPSGEYVRRWVPELGSVPGGVVHEPWKLDRLLTNGYPAPIVDHAQAAARYRAAG
ncbi:MAG: DNA photolyase family protein [Actinomycetota bacterium]|nr:DNA photolyase family protein [Actinomycetota bacterium]